MNINAETDGGGAVELKQEHGVWTSYRVYGVSDRPKSNLLYAGARLPNGKRIEFFLNRETGLVVVDVIESRWEERK